MPRQNRVNPFGELIATSARGTLMGNRGQLHNENQEIRRHYKSKHWIFCHLQYVRSNGTPVQRTIMSPQQYTELFFLDEVTSLAAGHRPCNDCDPRRFKEFLKCWAEGNPEHIPEGAKATAKLVDPILHEERWDPRRRTKRLHLRPFSNVPNGSMILLDPEATQPYLVTQESIVPWTFEGYQKWQKQPIGRKQVWALTPPSIMNAFEAGFRPNIHPSILNCV